jgi:hypothetical protein
MLGDNKIRHYRVSPAKTLTDNRTAEEMILEYVRKETGEDVVVETTKINNTYGIGIGPFQQAKDVLENLPKVRKQLEKQEVKSIIHQYNARSPWWQYLFHPIVIPYNWIVSKINAKWEDFQWKKMGGFPNDRFEYLDALSSLKRLPYLPKAGLYRYCTPCHFLTVTFDESTRDLGVKALQNDLKILADKKLIIGHLALPFQIQLADVVGSGESSYVIGCFLFVDDKRFEKLVGKENFRRDKQLPLKTLLELKTETFEDGLSDVDFRRKYEIEEVDIFEHEHQERRDVYIDNYVNPQRIAVNAKEAQEERQAQLKSYEEQQEALEKHRQKKLNN